MKNTIKKQLENLKKEYHTSVIDLLKSESNRFFSENPGAKTVEIIATNEYNDSDYYTQVNTCGETIRVNGSSFTERYEDDEDYKYYDKNDNPTEDTKKFNKLCEDASLVFSQFDDFYESLYGNYFTLTFSNDGKLKHNN